jgi:hypothetical protein
VRFLQAKFGAEVQEDPVGISEDVFFPLPLGLREAAGAGL